MSKALRKRHSSENQLMGAVKHKKIEHDAKENIPPKHYELIKPTSHNMCVQEVKTEATTPKKNRESLKELPVTPSTNFKLLANLAADLDYVQCSTPKADEIFDNQMSCDSDMCEPSIGKVNRKEKSLGIICTRFLAMYPLYPPPNEKIIVSLDEACVKLGVERRRLYDIVNVFESIDILTKNAKNQYLWFGKNNLLKSLYRLKDAAIKENLLEKLQYVLKVESNSCRSSCILKDVKDFNETLDSKDSVPVSPQMSSPDLKKEKSLGIMSQKFLMLFLVSNDKIISLGVAAKVLNSFLQRNEKGAQIKTQIRRLYDIANVLSSIGLIQKENAFSQCGRKPAFKYIGPDLKDDISDCDDRYQQSTSKGVKSRSLARHSSFQEICAVAEIEHQKLNLQESHNSAPPFDSSLGNEKGSVKTSFENLQLNCETGMKDIKNVNVENQAKMKIPAIIKRPLKIVNVKNTTVSPPRPYFIINNMPTEKSNIKCTTSTYGTQTFLLINTITPSKEAKNQQSAMDQQSVNKVVTSTISSQDAGNVKTTVKVSSPQTIKVTDEQRDTILQSLNISLSPEQAVTIHLNGGSQSNCSDTPANVVKIISKNSSRSSENKNIIKLNSLKEIDFNSRSTSGSNTPSSRQMTDSPISIPSGYATPVPSVPANVKFPSNLEVTDILKKIESQTSQEMSSNEVITSCTEKVNSCQEVGFALPYENINTSEKLVNGHSSTTSSINQAQLISNDSCSDDSVNIEISNIFNGKNLGDTSVKSKPFLIDEKTLLSPIKTNGMAQVSVPSNLITPPYMSAETVFLFNSSPGTYQTTNGSNISKFVPNILADKRKGN